MCEMKVIKICDSNQSEQNRFDQDECYHDDKLYVQTQCQIKAIKN